MKKSYIFVFLAILLLGTTYFLFSRDSSIYTSQLVQTQYGLLEKNYQPLTEKVTLNYLNKTTLSEIKLITPRIYNIDGVGFQKFAEIEFISYEDFKQYLTSNNFELIDLNTNKTINRPLEFKYKSQTGSCSAITLVNGTSQSCTQDEWKDISEYIFKSGEPVTIGVFTNVYFGDNVEWIPTIYGVKITEWATFNVRQRFALQDSWTQEELPTTNYGSDTKLSALGAATSRRSIAIQFNISDINGTITDSNLSLYLYETFGGADFTTLSYYASNQTWGEDILTFNLEGILNKDGTGGDSEILSGVGWYVWNITTILQKAVNNGNKNLTIYLNSSGGDAGYYKYLVSSEGTAGQRPYINLSFVEVVPTININLTSPANNTNFTTNNINFSANVNKTGTISIVNVSLLINGAINQTNTSGLVGTYNFSKTLNDGNYNWTVIAYGNNSVRYNAINGTLFFVVDTISPIVDITSPTQSNYLPGTTSIALNFVLVEANPNKCWYILNAGANTSIANCANTTLSGLTDGKYNFSLYANDTAGNSGSDNVSFIVGSVINVTLISPSNSSAVITTPIYFVSNLTSAFMNISNATLYVWYGNGTLASSNFTTMNSNNTQLNLSISGVAAIGFYRWNVVGRGTSLGNLISGYAADNFTFVIGTSVNNVTYNYTTFETKREVFKAAVSLPIGVNMQEAILVYNGTEYGADSIISSGSNIILSRTIDIPLNINATNNETKYFYWIFNMLQGSLSANQTSDTYNNTVYYIYLTLNSSAYQQLALNFTGREEQNNSVINISVEANLQYHIYDSAGTVVKIFNLINANENLSNYKLSIFPSNQTFKVSNVLSYYKTGYDRREYFFDNATVNNITQNINLYLLPTAISDLVTFQVLDENDAPIEDAFIYIQKWNIGENTFSTINILNTNEEGKATTNLKLNDLFYRYIVVYNGITYLTTPAAKEVQTSRLLRITINPLPDYSTFGSVSTTLSFNNATNVTSLVYTDTSGAVAQGCLKITDNSGSIIFYDCVDGVSGSITYQIVQNGSFTASSIITLIESEGAISKVVDVLFIRVGIPEKFEIIGKYGQAISFVLIGTAALIGVAIGSIILGLFLMVAAGGFVYMLGFLNFGSSMFLFISLILLIILTSIRRR